MAEGKESWRSRADPSAGKAPEAPAQLGFIQGIAEDLEVCVGVKEHWEFAGKGFILSLRDNRRKG